MNKKDLFNMSLSSDWSTQKTPAAAEAYFINFKWRGIGWYESATDTMLVLPTETLDLFRFEVWNTGNDVRKLLRYILALPAHEIK